MQSNQVSMPISIGPRILLFFTHPEVFIPLQQVKVRGNSYGLTPIITYSLSFNHLITYSLNETLKNLCGYFEPTPESQK